MKRNRNHMCKNNQVKAVEVSWGRKDRVNEGDNFRKPRESRKWENTVKWRGKDTARRNGGLESFFYIRSCTFHEAMQYNGRDSQFQSSVGGRRVVPTIFSTEQQIYSIERGNRVVVPSFSHYSPEYTVNVEAKAGTCLAHVTYSSR